MQKISVKLLRGGRWITEAGGGSKEASKELKLFNLSNYLTDRFRGLSQEIYEENVALNRRRLFWGGLLAIVGQLGYYAAYALQHLSELSRGVTRLAT